MHGALKFWGMYVCVLIDPFLAVCRAISRGALVPQRGHKEWRIRGVREQMAQV